MRLHRFHVPEPVGSRSELSIRSSALVNQLRRVLRLEVGDEIVVFDGSGSDHTVAIARFDGVDRVVLDVRASERSRYMPSRRIFLCAAVVKKDKFETIVEKATELGVTDIIPVLAKRSEKKTLNDNRLRSIVIEASEQSGRGDVPVIHPIRDLKNVINSFAVDSTSSNGGARTGDICKEKPLMFVFHTEGKPLDKKNLLKDAPLVLFVGPEGGWSPDELALFHESGVPVICLGPQVLRVETAVIAALAQMVFG